MRKKAIEKCGDTEKKEADVKDGAADDEYEPQPKGRRRSGNDTVQYLNEKAAADREMKAKELEFMEKKHNDSVEMQRTIMQSMLN